MNQQNPLPSVVPIRRVGPKPAKFTLNHRRIGPMLQIIVKMVSEASDVLPEEMRRSRSVDHVCRARQVVMYLARELTPASSPEIGALVGHSHSSVLRAHQQIALSMAEYPEVDDEIETLQLKIKIEFNKLKIQP